MPNKYLTSVSEDNKIEMAKVVEMWDSAKSVDGSDGCISKFSTINQVFRGMVEDFMQTEGYQVSNFISKNVKVLITLLLKDKQFKKAVKFYKELLDKGASQGDAIHKAAGVFGFESDMHFADVLHHLKAKGLLDESTETVMTYLDTLSEEGEPINTADKAMPDKKVTDGEPKDKKKIAKRKKLDKFSDKCGTKDDDKKDDAKT